MAKTKTDPTGQARRRNRGTRTLTRRLRNAERQIKKLFRDIPRERTQQTRIVNAVTPVYRYDLNSREQEVLNEQIRVVLNDELLESQNVMPPDWYWQDNIEPPYRQGTLEETNRTNQLIAAGIIVGLVTDPFVTEVTPEQVLTSRQYRQALQSVFVSNFNSIKTLSEKTAAQVIQQMNAGVASGMTPTQIAKDISERFDVAESSAKRIAETEINKAYNDSKMNAVDIMAERTGLRAGVIHISALSSTTRRGHAARHGNAYTTADQNQWWDSGTNRISCKCSTTSVLIDRQGKVVQSETQEEIKAERSFFDGAPKEAPVKKKKKPIKKKPIKKKPIKKKPIKKAPVKRKPELESTVSIDRIKTAKPKPTANVSKVSQPKKPVVTEDKKLTSTEKPPTVPDKVTLTGDQSAYVEYYKGQGFYENNQILRNPSAFSKGEVESAKKMRNSINSAVKKSTITDDGVLYRGIKDKDIFDNAEKLIGKDLPILTPQSTASNAGSATGWSGLIGSPKKGFHSANPGQSVVLKIKTVKGQHALNMESLSIGNTAEREMLLGSGGKYRVTGVKLLKNNDGKVTGKVLEVDYNE